MKAKSVLLIPLWGAIYYISGLFSQILNNSYTTIDAVWFPAGIAIIALKYSPLWQWFVYFVLFFVINQAIEIDDNIHIQFVSNLLYLLTPFVIAGFSLYFVRFQSRINRIIIWLTSIIVICGIINAIGIAVLRLIDEQTLLKLFLSAWFSSVFGMIFTAIVFDGLIKFNDKRPFFSFNKLLIGIISFMLLILSTWWIFSTPIEQFSLTIFKNTDQTFVFLLTYIPLIFVIFISIYFQDLGRSFSLFILGSIVISCTYHQQGPFFLSGLVQYEPLIIAQCYLTSIAIILLLISIYTDDYHQQCGGKHLIIRYELFPKEQKIIFDKTIEQISSLRAKSTLSEVMTYLDTSEQDKLLAHWLKKIFIKDDVVTFKINITLSHVVMIEDHALMEISYKNKNMLLGEWKIFHSELIKK